jgi:hypothetical protein
MSTAPQAEPPDHYVYSWINFNRDTFAFFIAAVRFYESLLQDEVKAVQADPELKSFLDEEALASYPVGKELERATRVRQWMETRFETAGNTGFVDIDMAHQVVRYIKSAAILFLEHLRRKRDVIASRPTTSKMLLEAIDQQLRRFEEKTQLGVFRTATPYPLIIDQLPIATEAVSSASPASQGPVVVPGPRPSAVVLDSIDIRDPEMRRRCLDLFEQFRRDGEHDRLDTVISEATRILEDRLRSLSAAPPSSFGVELATFAFRPPSARLVVSDVTAEQEAAHLLFRGVFGFVRNSAHHRLLGELQPERVLQVVGMVDYLISVAEAARRELPKSATSEGGAGNG